LLSGIVCGDDACPVTDDMAGGFEIIRCKCGHLSAGRFNCAKCGGQLFSSTTDKSEKNRAAQPVTSSRPERQGSGKNAGRTSAFTIAAIVAAISLAVFVGKTVDQLSKSIGSQRTPSVSTATTAKRISPNPVREIESTIPPLPVSPAAPIPEPPVQSLEIPSSALLKAQSPPDAPNANEPKRRPPGMLDMEAPAPGCIEKLPDYYSLASVCEDLDKSTCNKHSQCNWWYQPNNPTSHPAYCSPKIGLYVSSAFELDRPGPGQFTIDLTEPVYPSAESALANANRHAAGGRLDRAISAYSSLLVSNPDFPQVLGRRAALYERKGLKGRALADYCKILVVTSNRDRRLAARERIAALSGQGTISTSLPSPEKQPSIASPSPPTGEIQPRTRSSAIAPFNVQTESGQNYFIKLVNVDNAKYQIWIYVKGGESYSTKVPVGTYNFRAATGNEWYGREELFGPNTRFFRLKPKSGAAADVQPTLQFRKERNRIVGMTISLKGVANGNLEQEAMSRAQFDAN
jgi:hypothetical protein